MWSKLLIVFLIILVSTLSGIANIAKESQNHFESVFNIGNANIKMGETSEFRFSDVHSQKDQRTVISFKAVCYRPKPAGCSHIMSLQLNGKNITRYNSEGTERLIGRKPFVKLNDKNVRPIPVFYKNNILLFYDKDADEANKATVDNTGGNFIFDISDLVKEENTLKISNLLKTNTGERTIVITDMKIGWLKSSESKKSYKLENITKFGSKVISRQKSLDITIPAMPVKKGKVPILRFYAYTKSKSVSGCMYNMIAKLNGKFINRKTADGKDRLISRKSTFQLKSFKNGIFPVFGGDKIMLVYAPTLGQAQNSTKDNLGALFDLNISDIVMGVDGNTLTLENIYQYAGPGELIIENIEVGYLDKNFLKEPEIKLPKRGKIEKQIKIGKLTMQQGTGGGFVVDYDRNIELVAETGLGVDDKIQPLLIADDKKLKDSTTHVNIKQSKDNAFNISATASQLKLSRKINIENGIIYFVDTWENTGKQDVAVPFKYDFWLRNKKSKVIISGDGDADVIISSPNPTVFIEAEGDNGAGFGITAENNLARLIMWYRRKPGVAEMFTKSFAVPVGKKLAVKISITPVAKGGYWAFINKLRDRWKVNGITMQRPVFWGVLNAGGVNTADSLKKTLGHLGPVYIVNSPWLGLGWDSIVVRNGNYPKTEGGEAAGKCPDLDIKKYVSFEHREKYWKQLKEKVKIIHEACPNVKVLQMIHPAMEIIYKPLLKSFPFSGDALIATNGKPFELGHFNKAWVGNYARKDWAVQYFVPKANSAYADYIMKTLVRALDECNLDGIYCDEFSFASLSRGYSRYNNRDWDGFSVELDDNGKIIRKMSDNGLVTAKFKQMFLNEIQKRDKYFLGNSAAAINEVQASPFGRFIEGGNGEGYFSGVHLTGVPLIFGNFGDYKTKKGVFVNTKKCLKRGCMYSPFNGNLLFKSPDNFITKAYPISIKQIGPGTIIGKERIITTKIQNIKWIGKASTIQYYKYNQDGNLSDKTKAEIKNGSTFKIDVLKDGMTIAEIK